MTLHPETIARVRGHIARNLRLGQSWDDMRRNANASAARLGAEIAATITSPSEANDKRLAELFERAADMRAQYAALLPTGQGVPCSVAELPPYSAIVILLRDEQVRTMTRLWGVFVNGTAARDALARWQFGMVFDSTDQQIECVLRMGLDKFELRECQPEGFDVVAVLDLVRR